MHNDAMRKLLLVLSIFLTFSACNGGDASDAGIDAEAGVQADVAQDNGPIGPDVQSIDAVDVSQDH